MAGCANRQTWEANISKKVKQINFKVNELYTFGACGVSVEMITNHLEGQRDQCFQGGRFYLEEIRKNRIFSPSHRVDHVANLRSLRPNPFVHPKLDVVVLSRRVINPGKNQTVKSEYKVRPHCNASFANSEKKNAQAAMV